FNANLATPTVQQLQQYTAVVTYSRNPYNDATALGDNLATYFDAGGRVVVTGWALSDMPKYVLAGRFGTRGNGYMFLDPGPNHTSMTSRGVISEPMSPLVSGVKSLSQPRAFRMTGPIVNGGITVAAWGDGLPLIVRGKAKGRNRADINFYPASSN